MKRSAKERRRVFFDAVKIEVSVTRHRLKDAGLLKALFTLIMVMAIIFIISFVVISYFADPESLLPLLESAKSWGPLIIVGLIILEVVFAPVPGTFIMVAAGAVYGAWLGALYTYIGNIIGSLIAYVLARRFGRHLVERLISKKLLDRYDGFFNRHRNLFLLFYALPIIPVDVLSFSCGLSNIRWRKFLLIIMIGFIPNTFILAFLGDRLAGVGMFLMIVYTLLFLLVFLLLSWLFRLLVKRFSKKDL